MADKKKLVVIVTNGADNERIRGSAKRETPEALRERVGKLLDKF